VRDAGKLSHDEMQMLQEKKATLDKQKVRRGRVLPAGCNSPVSELLVLAYCENCESPHLSQITLELADPDEQGK